ncbi:MAG: cell division protein ZapC [Gammaproteobacteria bacterium]|nr:cell division protein ZapC [Gammaproteobacteria bacterium]MBU2057915.1 cell division protein ZapC [Gammaproteobacteria bacterium]MBU2174267.1 cell division protein ZapC [Gammaproteobacteria bacterium]MBU2247783.1 cell division protein ZapC [Gammaproteobacteria bacterium]MBU2344308.1 cell division protein ZapC [Gammaproteobacteria bacterium]
MLPLCPDWCWQYCAEQDLLLLQLSNSHHIQTAFSAKELKMLPEQQRLCMEQAQLLMDFAEALEGLLPDTELLTVAAQAVAALSFVKAPVQKSHLFNFSSIECATDLMSIAKLEGANRAKVLLVAKAEPMVDCLLLESMELLNGKQLSAGQLVRVQQNRLMPVQLPALYALTA